MYIDHNIELKLKSFLPNHREALEHHSNLECSSVHNTESTMTESTITKFDNNTQYKFGKPSTLGTSLKVDNPKINADITPASPYPINVYEKTRLPKF